MNTARPGRVPATGATVYVGRADAPFIRAGRPGPWPEITDGERPIWEQVSGGITQPPPCRVDIELDDGDRIDELSAVVIATPGHTDGSVALHLPDAGVLFTGDVAAEVVADPARLTVPPTAPTAIGRHVPGVRPARTCHVTPARDRRDVVGAFVARRCRSIRRRDRAAQCG